MKTICLGDTERTPDDFTGIIEEPDGSKYWIVNGEQHREDGPAAETADGRKYWYLDDDGYSETEFKKEMAKRNSSLGRLILNNKTKLEEE